jgi:hypothetical protein
LQAKSTANFYEAKKVREVEDGVMKTRVVEDKVKETRVVEDEVKKTRWWRMRSS